MHQNHYFTVELLALVLWVLDDMFAPKYFLWTAIANVNLWLFYRFHRDWIS